MICPHIQATLIHYWWALWRNTSRAPGRSGRTEVRFGEKDLSRVCTRHGVCILSLNDGHVVVEPHTRTPVHPHTRTPAHTHADSRLAVGTRVCVRLPIISYTFLQYFFIHFSHCSRFGDGFHGTHTHACARSAWPSNNRHVKTRK